LTAIRPYRESFHKLNLNPNKFMSSIEAMFTRVSKGKGLPSINPIVDLGNALSLKYTLPMGAHDLEQMDQDIQLRLSTPEDTFIPFGATEQQQMPADEPVYAVGQQIRTRRWIWQQSELGKITADSKDIFFPLDGFTDCNLPAITAAQQELAAFCRDQFNCTEIKIGLIDQQHPQMEL
ncbi:MAG: phenylalanine--tRNA ligase beta subunit-related protein, partial [Clostridiales bacterium]